MASFVVDNGIESTVADNPLSNVATTLNVATGEGVNFPSTFPYRLTIWDEETYSDPADDSNAEIITVTGRTSDALTIVREQEGTAGVEHSLDSRVAMLITAGMFNDPTYGITTKLDTIESDAKDDQTASEVPIVDSGSIITATEVEGALAENRTAIDLNTAKNTYPSADATKLSSIEESADVNNISDVNATDLTDGSKTILHNHGDIKNLTVTDFQQNAGSGNWSFPANINNDSLGDRAYSVSTGQYIDITFDKSFYINSFRYYGYYNMVGDGTFKIQHWDGSSWVDNTTGILSRLDSWSNWIQLDIKVITSKIRIMSSSIDSQGNISIVEMEMRGVLVSTIFLPAEAAYLPVTNPAGLVEELGATVYAGHSHLTFDDTTSEHAIWRVPMPDYDGGNIVVTAYSKVATTPAGAVTLQYNILTIGLANSEAFDAAVTVDTAVNISHSLNTTELLTDIMVASATIDPANVAADDLLVIELSRDVADNLSGDGELVGIMLEYTRA